MDNQSVKTRTLQINVRAKIHLNIRYITTLYSTMGRYQHLDNSIKGTKTGNYKTLSIRELKQAYSNSVQQYSHSQT